MYCMHGTAPPSSLTNLVIRLIRKPDVDFARRHHHHWSSVEYVCLLSAIDHFLEQSATARHLSAFSSNFPTSSQDSSFFFFFSLTFLLMYIACDVTLVI